MTSAALRNQPLTGSARLDRRQWVSLAVLTASTFVVLLDASVVNIALPVIVRDLGGSLDTATWVLAGFVLSFAVLLLPCARLADLYGRRLLFVLGMAVFALASLWCALAGSLEQLVAARVVQGAGAAMVEPTVLALITTTMPASRRGLAFGVQGIAAGLGVVLGPTLGGVITTGLSWEYIFLINVPVGMVAIIAALLVIPESLVAAQARRIDVPGAALSSAGLFLLVFPIIEGQRLGWSSPVVLGSFAAAGVLFGGFVVVERRVRYPLVDLSLFADRLFAVGNMLRAAVQFVTLGLFFPLVLLLQLQLGYSPIGSAIVLLPLVLTTIVISPLAGALSDRTDVRWLVVPGFLLVAGGAVILAQLVTSSNGALLAVPLALVGIGLGALEAPTTSATLRDVPATKAGIASGVSYVTLLVGAELGLAVTAAVVQNRLAAIGTAFSEAISSAVLVCAAVAVLAAIVSGWFRPRRPHLPTNRKGTSAMTNAPRIADDPFTAQGERIGDRPRAHETMRRAGPLVQVEAPAGGPVWIITDDALAREVLADPRFAKDPGLAPAHWHGRDPGLEPPAAQIRALTTVDGEEHRRLRRMHAPAFTRRRLLARRDRIVSIARDLLTVLAEESARTGHPADLAAQFAARYPLMVICDLLGVPLADLALAARASDAMSHGDAEQASAGLAELETLVAAAIRASHEHGNETLTDVLADRARAELGDLSDHELLYMITGLIFAGQVTTQSFLGFLLAHQLAGDLDAADNDAVDAFIAEVLRLHPPAPFTLWRFATTELELAGITLPAGAPVLVDIEGINTDPSRCPVPYALDPHRQRVPDLTFGDGPHVCIGSQLAVLEAQVVIEVLRENFPVAHLAVPFAELQRDRPGTQSRGLASLPTWLGARHGTSADQARSSG